jgi:hypothetical protein
LAFDKLAYAIKFPEVDASKMPAVVTEPHEPDAVGNVNVAVFEA